MPIENLSDPEKLKLQGNKFYSNGNYEEAIKSYSKAITIDASNAVLYSNRSIAYLKLKKFFNAEDDCNSALSLNKHLDKAYYRRGLARKELYRFKSALDDIQQALKLSPNNPEIKREYESLKMFLSQNENVKIFPIQKVSPFKSSLPLQNIQIENINEETVDIVLSDKMKKMITNRVPNGYNQFERDWRELSTNCIVDRLGYLERIDLPIYRKIFEYPFEPKILLEIISTLLHSKNFVLVFHILQAMTNMPRFGLNVCLFTATEFEVLRNIFQNLKKSKQLNNDEILKLAKLFNTKLD